MRFFRGAILAALLVCAANAEDQLAGGPYVIQVSARSATVGWVVRSSEARLGTAPDQLHRAAPVLRFEHVTYSGLKPGTTYYYDVLDRDEGKGSFKTAPAGEAAFEFVVFGDTRTRDDLHRRVVEAIEKTAPDFVIHTGDLVTDGMDTALWPRFFGIEREMLRHTAFFPAFGNHERNTPQFYEFFNMKLPYYSFDWGAAHFIVLDSDAGNVARSPAARDQFWDEQKAWLQDDLKRSQTAALRFVTFHHPPFTAVKSRQKERPRTLDLVPLFEEYKVAAVFSGHDHNYQHHVKNGVHYIVTGGGGAPLYPVDGPIPDLTRKVVSTEHYVRVKVEGRTARVEAVGLDGSQIETIELN